MINRLSIPDSYFFLFGTKKQLDSKKVSFAAGTAQSGYKLHKKTCYYSMTLRPLSATPIVKRSTFLVNNYIRHTTIRSISTTRSCLYSSNNKKDTSNSPFSAIANGINSIRSSLLNNTPLNMLLNQL
ncbi:unnamed protein product [Cunninghamella blakesleeana]